MLSQNQIDSTSQKIQQNTQLAQQAQTQSQQTQNTISHASQTLSSTQNNLAQLQHQQAQISNNITQLGSQIQQIAQQIQAAITQFNQGNLTQNGLYQSLYPLVAPIAEQDGLSPDLVLGVITEESGGNATIVSPAGAIGLMQLEPGTAQYLGINPAELSDPQVNLVAGCLYLKDMLALFSGNTSLALSAYNAGPGAVQSNNNQVLSYTQGYVNNIEALMGQYEQM
jgi:soluble lytic murein transglycosylase